jgi:Uma2 family endonuclease
VEREDIPGMRTVLSTSDQTVVLKGIRWETYERLLEDLEEANGTRLSYDCGTLEIMSPSSEHEQINDAIRLLFQELAFEMGVDVVAVGSTTFRRKDLLKGFEPDASFYIHHAEAIRARKKIDLSVDPPPDVVVEIEASNPVIGKLSIFAAAGVPEVWLYRNDRIEILGLGSNTYHKRTESSFLPGVTDNTLTEFVHSSRRLKSTAWIRSIRDWAVKR